MFLVRRKSAVGLRWILLCLVSAILLLPGGCGKKDVVVQTKGWSMTLDEAAKEYERVNGIGSWAKSTAADRGAFVRTMADKEIVLRLARRAQPQLDDRQSHHKRVQYEDQLIKDYAYARRASFAARGGKLDSLQKMLGREASVRGTIFPNITSAEMARAEVKEGGSFEDVSYRLGKRMNPTPPGQDPPKDDPNILHEMKVRIDMPMMYGPYVIETLMRGLKEGDLTQPMNIKGGVAVFQIVALRDLPEAADQKFFDRATTLIQGLNAGSEEQHWQDSLKTAVGYKLHPENYPILHRRMVAFQDSLDGLRRNGINVDRSMLAPPSVGSMSPEERKAVIFEMRGKGYTVEDFVNSLRDIDLNYWPLGDSLKTVTRIQDRAQRWLYQTEAEKIGFDKSPEFLAHMRRVEEEGYLTQYHDGLKVPEPTESEVEAEYGKMPGGGMMSPERLSLSALLYPIRLRTRAESVLPKLRAAGPTGWENLAAAEHQADNSITYVPPTPLVEAGRPLPDPSLQSLFAAVGPLQTGAISDVLPGEGTYNIIYVVDHRPPGPMSLEGAKPRMREKVVAAKQDSVLEMSLTAERAKTPVEVFADILSVGAAPPDTTLPPGAVKQKITLK